MSSICPSSDCEGNAEYVDIAGLSSASSLAAYVLKAQPNVPFLPIMSPMGRVPLLPFASAQEIRKFLFHIVWVAIKSSQLQHPQGLINLKTRK